MALFHRLLALWARHSGKLTMCHMILGGKQYSQTMHVLTAVIVSISTECATDIKINKKQEINIINLWMNGQENYY